MTNLKMLESVKLLFLLLICMMPVSLQTEEFPTNSQTAINFDAQAIYSQLLEQYYAQVPFDIPPEFFSDAIAAFFAFLELPDDVKNHMQDKIAPQHRRGDLGLTHRDSDGEKKDFFHYHPHLLTLYSEFIAEQPEVNRFISYADKIWHSGVETTKNILLALEKYSPDLCSKVFNDEEPHIVLRFLRYQWNQAQDYLARPHYDAGSFTLAMAESGPGLRIGSGPHNLTCVVHHTGQAIFFLSVTGPKLTNREELLPGWHDVIMLNKTEVGETFSRWAIVMFINGHSENATRSETHPWQPMAMDSPR